MITIHYSNKQCIREKIILHLLNMGIALHTQLYMKRKVWNINSEKLKKYREGSIGHCLYLFYRTENFEPIPKLEYHDVFHVLLGYSTGMKDENCMQFLLLGNGKHSPFTIATCFIAFLFFPEWTKLYYHSYKKGKGMLPFTSVNFQHILHADLHAFKRQFNIL